MNFDLFQSLKLRGLILKNGLRLKSFLLFSREFFPQARQLDNTFGNKRVVTASFNNNNYSSFSLKSVLIQDDGKIITTCENPVGGYKNFAVIRFDNSGQIDSTFGTNGMVITSVSKFSIS